MAAILKALHLFLASVSVPLNNFLIIDINQPLAKVRGPHWQFQVKMLNIFYGEVNWLYLLGIYKCQKLLNIPKV